MDQLGGVFVVVIIQLPGCRYWENKHLPPHKFTLSDTTGSKSIIYVNNQSIASNEISSFVGS